MAVIISAHGGRFIFALQRVLSSAPAAEVCYSGTSTNKNHTTVFKETQILSSVETYFACLHREVTDIYNNQAYNFN